MSFILCRLCFLTAANETLRKVFVTFTAPFRTIRTRSTDKHVFTAVSHHFKRSPQERETRQAYPADTTKAAPPLLTVHSLQAQNRSPKGDVPSLYLLVCSARPTHHDRKKSGVWNKTGRGRKSSRKDTFLSVSDFRSLLICSHRNCD